MRHVLRLLGAALIVCAGAAGAQDAGQPVLRVALPEGDVVVGQPVELRLTVLVPTWMPSAPVYPEFEVPDLMVRLPDRATQPVSEAIGGETWSGTTRGYRLYPLVPGPYVIPAQAMTVTYADPDTTQPVTLDLPVASVAFRAVLPEGAEGLDPPIVAQGFEIEQTVEGATDMQVGDALVRRVTARIDGTTAILIPALVPGAEQGPLRAYPDEPVVTEAENRGVLSGSRAETITYVAQAGGAAELPELRLDWFNLASGRIETARVDAVPVNVAPPPPPPADPRDLVLRAAAVVGLAVIGYALLRRVWPSLAHLVSLLRRRWLDSERRAHRSVLRALHARDLPAVLTALAAWRRHVPRTASAAQDDLDRALAPLRAARYGSAGQPAQASDWRRATAAYRRLHRDARRAGRRRHPHALPGLNPVSGPKERR